ncbi:MAG: aminoacyl-tRNA hydrolase [Simkaniaceae bacterium]|nr:aminoacyl-tRNA hydrolase [Simkaniaceae bacterium]
MNSDSILIVGLGNPGKKYSYTRHNLGFLIVDAFAAKYDCDFRTERDRQGSIAKGVIHQKNVLLLKPLTFMNESGRALKSCMDYYKILVSDVLVISDDISIPFGSLKMRSQGGTGGHNGLKSVQAHLNTQEYPRLRVGIGDRIYGDLSSHVLSKFNDREMLDLPKIINAGVEMLDRWVSFNEITLKRDLLPHQEI